MLTPTQITFRGMAPVEALEANIRLRAAHLERYYPSINSCHIVVEPVHRHHVVGNRFRVRLNITVPAAEIAVEREASLLPAPANNPAAFPTKSSDERLGLRRARVAIREAFDAARRQLQDVRRRQRRAVKEHDSAPRGRVVKLLPDGTGGFIAAADGHEVYFHRNSVLDRGFDHLDLGSDVVFTEEAGDRGPQASTVRPVSRRGALRCGIAPRAGRAPEHRPDRGRSRPVAR